VEVSALLVKDLREKTGAGIMDCKKALVDGGGDLEKAIEILRKQGISKAVKKSGRKTTEGLIGSYVHLGGRIGVLLEVNCETDFVANTDVFKEFVKDLTLQIASAQPLYLSREDVSEEILEKEKEIYRAQALNEGKPEKVVDRIVEGRIKKFYEEACLMEQPFVKEDQVTIREFLERTIAKTGENIIVRRFTRYLLGEELS
jgi:elongation factor Ts